MHGSSPWLSVFGAAALLLFTGCSDHDQPTPPPPGPPGDDSPLGTIPGLPVDARDSLSQLAGKVDVVRDKDGRPHIYASSLADAMRVEGFLIASDRAMQLELLRRISEGRLAELFSSLSPSTIDFDITYRNIGLARTAQAEYDALPPGPVRDAIDAYADGVTQAFRKIRSGEVRLPPSLVGISGKVFTDWTPVDSLTVARFQTYLLSYDGDEDMRVDAFFGAARSTFTAADPDPVVAKRHGLERDLLRFAPSDPTTILPVPPGNKAAHGPVQPSKSHRDLLSAAAGYLDAMSSTRGMFTQSGFGSNNWAVAPSRSATGHVLLASDPHLSLSSPSLFWPVSIQVKAPSGGDASWDLDISGLAFPGIPAIILGHNANVAWGSTVSFLDVTDIYHEQLTPDGAAVVYKGAKVPLETINEVIQLDSGASITYPVQVVPHHGPIVPTIVNHQLVPIDPKVGALSTAWTGTKPSHEIEAVFDLIRAKNVDDGRTALNQFGVGDQNWLLGDTSGNILWTSHVLLPTRDKGAYQWDASTYQGTLPCTILPGDGTAEWTGYLPDDLVPWTKNPSNGYLVTANNDPVGGTLDNDTSNDVLPDGTPAYLTSLYDIGFRAGKISARIEAHKDPLTTSDFSAIQGDDTSSMGISLTPALITALENAASEKKTPGTFPDLTAVVTDPAYDTAKMAVVHDLLVAWGAAGYHASSGIDPDSDMPLPASGASAPEVAASQATLIFNAWQVRLASRAFDDELSRMKLSSYVRPMQLSRALIRLVQADPKTFATYDAVTGDSSLWDDLNTPGVVESRRQQMVRAMLDALDTLATKAGPDISTYRWGAFHTVKFVPSIPLWTSLVIPPPSDHVFGATGFPRHGDMFAVDASDYVYADFGSPFDFTYSQGPVQRFVIDLDPAGPRAFNALPGGAIWDPASPHFRDEAELWRKNQTHLVPFALADVVAAKESRTLFASP